MGLGRVGRNLRANHLQAAGIIDSTSGEGAVARDGRFLKGDSRVDSQQFDQRPTVTVATIENSASPLCCLVPGYGALDQMELTARGENSAAGIGRIVIGDFGVGDFDFKSGLVVDAAPILCRVLIEGRLLDLGQSIGDINSAPIVISIVRANCYVLEENSSGIANAWEANSVLINDCRVWIDRIERIGADGSPVG